MSERNPKVFPQESGLTNHGITLRDYFAAAALTGILAANAKCAPEVDDKNVDAVVAREAYASADAMLTERSKKP